jgi:hypothetical protein
MKFIINENKADQYIYKYIDQRLKEEELYKESPYLDSDQPNENIIGFFGESFSSEREDDPFFEYFSEEEVLTAFPLEDELGSTLVINKTNLFERFKGMFGNRYRKQFKLWFETNYPELPVKTYKFEV